MKNKKKRKRNEKGMGKDEIIKAQNKKNKKCNGFKKLMYRFGTSGIT